jgi:hypothetical protein
MEYPWHIEAVTPDGNTVVFDVTNEFARDRIVTFCRHAYKAISVSVEFRGDDSYWGA